MTIATAKPAPGSELTSFPCTGLALPFTGWRRFGTPVPEGFTASADLDPIAGEGHLRLAARPHPPSSLPVVRWYWAGWKQRVGVQLATNFVATVHCDELEVSGGGQWVPRCFMTAVPVGGGASIESRVVLSRGRTTSVLLHVPQSANLPAVAYYDLSVAFSVRAAFLRAETPQGRVRAHLTEVKRCFAFPTLAEGSTADEALAGIEPEPDDLDPRELAAVLATLDQDSAE